jgi:hypothetical protein
LKWFGPRLKDIIIATFDKMGLEWKLWKICGWGGLLEQVCMFVGLQYHLKLHLLLIFWNSAEEILSVLNLYDNSA